MTSRAVYFEMVILMVESFPMNGDCGKDHNGSAIVVLTYSASGDLRRKIRHESSDYTAGLRGVSNLGCVRHC